MMRVSPQLLAELEAELARDEHLPVALRDAILLRARTVTVRPLRGHAVVSAVWPA